MRCGGCGNVIRLNNDFRNSLLSSRLKIPARQIISDDPEKSMLPIIAIILPDVKKACIAASLKILVRLSAYNYQLQAPLLQACTIMKYLFTRFFTRLLLHHAIPKVLST